MQEFIVSTLEDENDGDFSQRDLSLREAIALANEQEGSDTITFDDSLKGGTVTLVKDQPTSSSSLANSPLAITDSVAIEGLGRDNLTIDGDNGGNSIFEIGNENQEIDVTVEDLTITNGAQLSFSDFGLTDFGGSFFISANANFTLQNSVITDSSASVGGAIYNQGQTNIIDSTIENNSSSGDDAAPRRLGTDGIVANVGELNVSESSLENNSGSALFNVRNLNVENSSLSNNRSRYVGGGVDNRSRATITNTTISGNSANSGSGVYNRRTVYSSEEARITINDSTISENTSRSSENSVIFSQGTVNINNSAVKDNDGAQNVGILIDSGTAKIEGSTISNNNAPDIGASGVIVLADASADIINSTIANNSSRANAGIVNNGTVDVTNSTVTGNNGGIGTGGVANFNDGVVNLSSSIVANNIGTGDGQLVGDINGEFISGGNNLVSNGDDATGFVESDLVGTLNNPIDPQLGELQDNGGITETIALLTSSPAIDTGNNPNNLETDQRGEGFDRTVGDATDIGAFELQNSDGDEQPDTPTELVVSTLEDENDGDFSAEDLSLREAIAQAESGDTITFDSNLSGGTITLALGELAIDKSLTIQGLGAENMIIDANGNSRIFNIDDGNEDTQIDVALNSLAITGSEAEFDSTTDDLSFYYGGGIFNSENLEVNNANIYDNQTIFRGGGIYSEGTLSVNNSAIYSNVVNDPVDRGAAGGGIYSEGTLSVNNSAIYSNVVSVSFASASGGGITNAGTATIDQSTISDNGVGGRLNSGGGIENREGDLTITNSTISNNSSNLTGGILNNAGEVTVTSTIIANVGNQNISGDDFVSGGNNFISGEAEVSSRGGPVIISAEGFTDGENGDIVGTLENPIDPLLGELQNNGGSTPTQALLDGSPAIDAGSNPNNLETDQRGEGFDRTVGDATDIGAFELQTIDDSQPGDRILKGTHGDDFISGTSDDDIIFGLQGNDRLDGNDGNDLLRGGRGKDTLLGGADRDTLQGGRGDDNLVGSLGDDLLFGDRGNDVINGEAGDDFISGGKGNDLLRGGEGSDTLEGGKGKDLFALELSDEHDVIVDFKPGSDRLLLSDGLSFGQLEIVSNESNTATLILDSADSTAIITAIANIHPADLTAHDFY